MELERRPDWLDKCCDHIFESLKTLPKENDQPISIEKQRDILYQVIEYINMDVADNPITQNQWAVLDSGANHQTVGTHQEPLYIKHNLAEKKENV